MASWEESLKIGENFEVNRMNDIYNKIGLKCIKNELYSNLKLYDFTIENGITIECKCDKKAEETKNICIETHCNNNESGILTTSADYWLITDNVKGYLIKTIEIKRCIEEGYTSLYPDKPTKFLHMTNYPVKQEDKSIKLMNFYTIPTWLFSKYCEEVEDINNMKYDCLK